MLKVAYNDIFVQPLPPGHRFPMQKYELLPQQLLLEGTLEEENFFSPEKIKSELVTAVHTPEYFHDLVHLKVDRKGQRTSGFPHNERLIQRELYIMEATRKCAEYALQEKVAMNISGGTHHAYSNRGEGFCLLNDQAIAAQWLLNQNLAQKILILDLDVHQGNGTAEIFQNNNKVFTFSLHGENNYPLKKEKSDLDIGLKDGTEDKEYLYALEKGLAQVFQQFTPDFLFFQSGVDILATDKLGRLAVSEEGCKKRDERIFHLAKETHLPLVVSMGGGYSEEIKHIIEAHANTFRVAQEYFG